MARSTATWYSQLLWQFEGRLWQSHMQLDTGCMSWVGFM